MLLDEIVNSCMHERVAEAALASLGADIPQRVRLIAREREMSAGAYVAALVRRFVWRAGPGEHRALARAVRRTQAPMLAGLRHILRTMLKEERELIGGSMPPPSAESPHFMRINT